MCACVRAILGRLQHSTNQRQLLLSLEVSSVRSLFPPYPRAVTPETVLHTSPSVVQFLLRPFNYSCSLPGLVLLNFGKCDAGKFGLTVIEIPWFVSFFFFFFSFIYLFLHSFSFFAIGSPTDVFMATRWICLLLV